jgi:hypothetical protein
MWRWRNAELGWLQCHDDGKHDDDHSDSDKDF